jgi:hypothetical protein
MKKLILCCALLCWVQLSLALTPYVHGSRLAAADLATQLTQVEKKLQAEGFTLVGRHTPKGMPQYGSVVVTDPAMLEAIRGIGGSAVIASGIRVGVQSDGTVSYMKPDYSYRAYLRGKLPAREAAVKSVQSRLSNSGRRHRFGDDVPEGDLSNYRYMFGMERFDSSTAS